MITTLKCRNDGAWRITSRAGAAYAYVENTAVTNYNGTAGHVLDLYLTRDPRSQPTEPERD